MQRPRLNMNVIENNYTQIVNDLMNNNLFVCQLKDGVLVMIERQGTVLNSIMVNPMNYEENGITKWSFDFNGLEKMYMEVFSNNINIFYSVELGKNKMMDVFPSLTDALTCLKTGSNYGGYRLRKLN